MPLEPKEAAATLAELLAKVKKADPKAEARATLLSVRDGHTRFAKNEVTTSGEGDESSVSLHVALGKRHASASSNQTDSAALAALANRTLSMARVSPEDPEAMPVLGAQKASASGAAYDEGTAKLSAKERAEAARLAIEAAKAAGLVVAGFVEHWAGTKAVATSAGLALQQKLSSVEMSATARTPDGSGSGWAAVHTRKASQFDAKSVARIACEKAALSKSPKRLEPGRYTVLLEPRASDTLMWWLHQSLDARSADEGRSFFSKVGGGNRLGEKVLSPKVTLVSNPMLAETPGQGFDDEGALLPPMTWVENGVIKTLRTSRFWAQKTGTRPTGEYGGVSLAPGTDSFDAMLSKVKRGVLITRFWYTNYADPQSLTITGLTRDGTFLIEDGKLVGAVNNFRFNESVPKAFEQCEAIGADAPLVGNPDSRCPALLIRDFNLASVSEAV